MDKQQKTGQKPKLCPFSISGGRAEELWASLISFVWEKRSIKIIYKDLDDNRWLNSQDGFAENKLTNLISSYDSPVDQGKTIHVIHLGGSKASDVASYHILTRQIRKSSPDEANRLDKGVGSLLNSRVQRTGDPQVPTLAPKLFNNGLNVCVETTHKFPDCTYLRDAVTIPKFKQIVAGGGLIVGNQLHSYKRRMSSYEGMQKLQKITSCGSTNTWKVPMP